MRKTGKKYRIAASVVERGRLYSVDEGVALAKKSSYSSFDGSIDLAVNLGVDPRHANQNVRGAVSLPHGLGKKARIVVFAQGEKVLEAEKEWGRFCRR